MNRKYNLNSDGHQFHQYQQNEQSPLILTDHSEHFGQAYQCGAVKPVNGNLKPSPLDNGVSKGNTYHANYHSSRHTS